MELKQLLEQATPLPWMILDENGVSVSHPSIGLLAAVRYLGGDNAEGKANAALVVHAVNMLPKLVEALKETIPVLNGQFNESDRRFMASRLDTILAEANNLEVSSEGS